MSLNVIRFLQTLFNDMNWLKQEKEIFGILYSGLIFIVFLLTVLLSFHFLIKCLFNIFGIVKEIFSKAGREKRYKLK